MFVVNGMSDKDFKKFCADVVVFGSGKARCIPEDMPREEGDAASSSF